MSWNKKEENNWKTLDIQYGGHEETSKMREVNEDVGIEEVDE